MGAIRKEEAAVIKPAEATPDRVVPSDKGDAIVLQPDEGESYWQPKPANGYRFAGRWVKHRIIKASGFGPKIGH